MAKYAGVDKETGEALYNKDTDKGETTTTNASEATMHLCGTALPDAYGGFGTSVSNDPSRERTRYQHSSYHPSPS